MSVTAPCSRTDGGAELTRFANQVKGFVKKQRQQLQKYWPCFKGILSEIKSIAITINFCTNPVGAAIIQEMRDLFKEGKWPVTKILNHIAGKVKGLQTPYMGPYSNKTSVTFSDYVAFVLKQMAKVLSEKTNEELKKSAWS